MSEDTNTLEMVIYDGIRFLDSLTRHYGHEKGQEVWASMGEALGKEVRGKIFFAMVQGHQAGRLTFTADSAYEKHNTVAVIRAIRNYTNLTLKEAKDIWDKSVTDTAIIKDIKPKSNVPLLARELRDLGCLVY